MIIHNHKIYRGKGIGKKLMETLIFHKLQENLTNNAGRKASTFANR